MVTLVKNSSPVFPPLVIKISNCYSISWNLDDGQAFAISENSVNEAGCIHTTQGLEFDYVGVIMGDDIRYEDGHVVTDFTKKGINRSVC